jgi:hypothetical protein
VGEDTTNTEYKAQEKATYLAKARVDLVTGLVNKIKEAAVKA